MEKLYGLKKGDKITVEGQYDVQNAGADTANAMLLEAFKASGQLTVIRDGKEITLPLPKLNPSAARRRRCFRRDWKDRDSTDACEQWDPGACRSTRSPGSAFANTSDSGSTQPEPGEARRAISIQLMT